MPENVMSGALATQVGAWFNMLDPSVQAILEAIWVEAPAAVSKVISGGEWESNDSSRPLAEAIYFDPKNPNAPVAQAGYGLALSMGFFDTTPSPPVAGSDITVSWTLFSGPGQVPFVTNVTWRSPSGDEGQESLPGGPIQAGGELPQSFVLSRAVAGTYSLTLDVNPDGADEGEPPNANGTHVRVDWPVEVLEADAAANQQDTTAAGYAASCFAGFVNVTAESWGGMKESFRDGVNWLASVDPLPDGGASLLASIGGKVDAIRTEDHDRLSAAFANLAVAGQRFDSSDVGGSIAVMLAALSDLDSLL